MSRNAYARGRKALGICDRCGQTWRLDKLKTERNNENVVHNLVCPSCWDPDHPQNRAGRIDYSDPIGLRNPRSDSSTGRDCTDRFRTCSGDDFTASVDGWTTNSPTTLTTNATYLTVTNAADTYNSTGLNRSRSGTALNIDTSVYKFVRMRFRVTQESESTDWKGLFAWIRTTDSSTAANRFSYNTRPTLGQFGEQWHIVEWDLTNEAEWTGTVDGGRVNIYEEPGSIYDVDYIRFESH